MFNSEATTTGHIGRNVDNMQANKTPAGCRTGTLAELTRRCAAWLEWRAGLRAKPDFKPYVHNDRSTWYLHRVRPLKGAAKKSVEKANKSAK